MSTSSEKLADDIIKRRKEELKRQINGYPRKNVILSDISECDRYLVYSVLDWDRKPLHDEGLQARFNAGKTWEREAIRELQGLGYDVLLSQSPVQINNRSGELVATGRIDGFITNGRERLPFEIKTMQPNIFNTIHSTEDFQKRAYLRKYIRQLMLYMFGHNCEEGIFVILDGLGRWKVLPLLLDYGTCEWLLQRLERAHENIKTKTYPDRINYDQEICGRCPFAAICLPDVINKGADMIENEDLERDIDRHEEIRPVATEYRELHDQIKKTFENVEKATVGVKYLIMNVPTSRATYDLPPEVEEEIKAIKQPFLKKCGVNRLVIQSLERGQT